jgi:hypothetical protein
MIAALWFLGSLAVLFAALGSLFMTQASENDGDGGLGLGLLIAGNWILALIFAVAWIIVGAFRVWPHS